MNPIEIEPLTKQNNDLLTLIQNPDLTKDQKKMIEIYAIEMMAKEELQSKKE